MLKLIKKFMHTHGRHTYTVQPNICQFGSPPKEVEFQHC